MKVIIKLYNQIKPKQSDYCNKTEHLYFIYNEHTKLSKIGITTNLQNRLSALTTASGCKLVFINYCTLYPEIDMSAKYIEKFLHDLFSEYRGFGEWFNLSQTQQNIISNFIDYVGE